MRSPLKPLAIALALTCLAACGTAGGGAGGPGRTAPPAAHFETLSLPAKLSPKRVHVPILTYHRVHEFATEQHKSVPDLTVEPATFRAEIAALARDGYHSVSQRQLFEALYRGGTLPSRPVLISVDDGYVDDVTQILPVLKSYGMTATFYVITGRFHEAGFLTADQVKQLEAAGMEIGAHTRHHVPLPELRGAALDSEVAGSRSDLEAVLGHPVYWFAYPFGAHDAAVIDAVRRAGFLTAVTTDPGTIHSALSPFTLPRLHVGRAAGPVTVLGLVSSTISPAAAGGVAG